MKQLFMIVALVAMQLAAATIVNTNSKTPALAMSPWTSDPIVKSGRWNSDIDASATGAQVVNGTIYTVQTSGSNTWRNSVAAVNGSSGALFWTTTTWNKVTWMSVKGSVVVIATDNYFAGLNTVTGATNWNFTIVDGYNYDASTPAMWTDDDCIIAMVNSYAGYNAKLYHILPFSATGTPMLMWNSTSVGTSVTSYFTPRGPFVIGTMNSSLVVVQGFANAFMVLNLTNTSAAVPIRYTSSGSPSGLVRVPVVVNNSVYWFSGDYGSSSSTSYIYEYNMDMGGARTRYPISNYGQIQSGRLYNNGSKIGFAFQAYNYSSNCILFSTNLTGSVVGYAGNVIATDYSGDYDCTVLSYGPNEVYLQDDDRTLYRYSFGANGFDWRTPTMARSGSGVYGCSSGSQTGQYVNGKFYYAGTDCYNNSVNIEGWSVQMNAMTGAYETLLPTPKSQTNLPVAWLYDGTSFGGSVVQYGTVRQYPNDYPYLISRVVAGGAQKGTWLAGGVMINSPVTYKGKVYMFSAKTVYCFGLENGTLMWSQAVANTISSSVNAVVAGGNLFVPTSSTSRNIYVFDLFNAVPSTMISIPTTVTGCPVSTDRPTALVSDPEKPYVYFAADDGQCVVQFTKTITTAVGAPTKDSGDVVNPPVLNGDYAYYNDYSGRVYYQRISKFSSTLPLMRGASLSSEATYSSPSPISVYQGGVYTVSTGAPDKLYRFGTKTLVNGYVAKINSLDDNVAPLTMFKKVYAVLTNGSFACFPQLPPLLSKTVVANWVINPNMGSTLGQPVWTNYGKFIFATSKGLFCVDYSTGNIDWKITQDAGNRSLTCAGGAIATRQGIAYVQCNQTLYLIDIPKGRIYLRGATVETSRYVIDTSNQNNLNILTIAGSQIASFNNLTTRLYSASELPAPIDGSESLLDIIKNNKIWIAAVVAVVVVLIIIIAVAVKLCGGGKKDTDYVAMQNPVNTGGV